MEDVMKIKAELEKLKRDYAALERNFTAAERELSLYKEMCENAPTPFQSLDKQGRFIEINKAWTEELGYNKDEIIGKSFEEILPEEFKSAFKTNFNNFLSAGSIKGVEYELMRKNGEGICVKFVGKVGKHPDGSFNRTYCVFQNISEEKKAEKKLLESEEKFRLLAENSSDMIVLFEDFEITYVSPAVKPILGYEPEELIALDHAALVHPEEREDILNRIRYRIENKVTSSATYLYRQKGKDGEYRWLETVVAGKIIEGDIVKTILNARDITKAKLAEQALKDNEIRFQLLAENIPGAIYQFKADKNGSYSIPYMSKSAEKVFQAPLAELTNVETLFKIVHKDDKKEFFLSIERSKRDMTVWRCEYRAWVNGVIKWIRGVSRPRLQRDGSVVWNGVLLDITQSKKAELALAESEEKFRQLFENMAEAFALHRIILDEDDAPVDYVFIDVNPAFEQMLGLKKENVIGRRVLDVLPNTEKIWIDNYGRVAATGESMQFYNFSAEFGKYYEVKAYSPKKYYFAVTFADITDRIKAEIALKESEEKYRSFFETAPLGIFHSTPEGRFIEVNPALAKMLGYDSPQEVVENIYSIAEQIYVDGRRRKPIVEETAEKDEIVHYENVYRRKDGSQFTANLYLKSVKDENGEIAYLEGMVEDITERIEAEKILRESEHKLREAVETKDKFLSIIAHDLKGPLSGYMQLTKEIIDDFYELSLDELQEMSQALHKSSCNIYNLLENLLLWSRSNRGRMNFKPENLNVAEFVGESIAPLRNSAKNKNVEFIEEIDPELLVFADKYMAECVLRNLCSNALKFTPSGKSIRVVSQLSESGFVNFSVADEGVGMDSDTQNKIFKLDQKVSQNGTEGETGAGLGLLLCKEFVEKNGGDISFESAPDIGTTFNFTLPAPQ